MDQITTIDNAIARKLADIITKAVQDAVAELGLEAQYKGGKYDSTMFTPKIVITAPGAAHERVASDLKAYGIDAEHGTEFTASGQTFRITGVNFRATKMPIQATDVRSGKTYKFAASTVQRALGQAEVVGRVFQ